MKTSFITLTREAEIGSELKPAIVERTNDCRDLGLNFLQSQG